MSNLLRRLAGIIYVEQRQDTIEIGGIAAERLAWDIRSTWGTSKIGNNIFTRFDKRAMEFKLFYALEMHFILQSLLKNRRNNVSRDVILKTIKELEEKTWLANLAEDKTHPQILDRSKLKVFKKTPLPHQDLFFDRYEKGRAQLGLHGFLLSAAPGAGKTLTNLMVAEMVGADFTIIVSPKNAVYRVWDKTIREEYKDNRTAWVASDGKPYKKEKYLIGHYEALPALLAEVNKLSGKVVVVLDECHNFNTLESLRTQLFLKLCKESGSQDIIWASGTPIKALGGEAIPLLKSIDPLFDDNVQESFKKIFGVNAKRALDILKHRMGFVNYRVERAEFNTNKTTTREIRVKIPNGDEYTLDAVRAKMLAFIQERLEYYKKSYQKYEDIYLQGLKLHEKTLKGSDAWNEYKLYKRNVDQVKKFPDPRDSADEMKAANRYEKEVIMPAFDNEFRKRFRGAKSVVKYVHLKVMGEALGGILGRARTQVHVDMLKHIDFRRIMGEAEKKTVIFTSYVEVVKELDKQLRQLDMKPMLVFGETNKNLTENVGAFEKDDEVDPLVATYPSLSTAVPLVMADLAIFCNVPFRAHEMEQAKARLDRLGQDTPVKYVNIFLDTGEEPNISTRSKDILEWSRAQVQAILGTDYGSEAKEVYDGYEASLESFEGTPQAVVDFEKILEEILD